MSETRFELLTNKRLEEIQGGVIVTGTLFAIGFGVGYIGTTNLIDAVHRNWTRKW